MVGLLPNGETTGNMDTETTLASSPGGQVGTLSDTATVRNMNARRVEVGVMIDKGLEQDC
jgi:hypothetical protein